MKRNTRNTLAATAVCCTAGMASANSLTFQGVTFNTNPLDADTLKLEILNADMATGDWSGIGYIAAFEIKGIGTVTGASIASAPAGSAFSVDMLHGVAASVGCTTGGTAGACFSGTPYGVSSSMAWTLDFTGTGLDFRAPELKVQFLTKADDPFKTGSLLSVPVPEPETYAMMLAGLGALTTIAGKKRKTVSGTPNP